MSITADDIRAVYEAAKNPGYEPREKDIRYIFVHQPGRTEILKIVVTSIQAKKDSEPEAISGYVYGKPNENVRIALPYPVFKSVAELKAYYIKFFNAIAE